MGSATVKVDGENKTFANSVTYNAYTEWNKTKVIEEKYEKIRFYAQLSNATTSKTKYGWMRVILNNYDSDLKILKQGGTNLDLKQGEEAQLVELPFADFNNLYVIFTSKVYDGEKDDSETVSMTIADLQFINYEEKAPTAELIETDVTSNSEGEVVSTATIEFSQKMKSSEINAGDFEIDGEAAADISWNADNTEVTLTFSRLMDFDKEYSIFMNDNVKNDCEKCSFAVADESKSITAVFKQPSPLVIGDGVFKDESGEAITAPVAGKVTYTVPVKNKYDLTEGGREMTLFVMLYTNGQLKQVKCDQKKLVPGDNVEFTATVSGCKENESEVYAFLWDNPLGMNSFDAVHSLVQN